MEKTKKQPKKKAEQKRVVNAIEPKKNNDCKEYVTSVGKITDYAIALYQNAGVGMQSIHDILPAVKCQHLKSELENEYVEFRKIKERVKEFAHDNHFQLKSNSFMEKAKMWMSIKCGTLFNKTTRHIAELMIVGTVMGLNQVYKDQHDYKCTSRQLDSISADLELIFERNYSNLKLLLKGGHEIEENKKGNGQTKTIEKENNDNKEN